MSNLYIIEAFKNAWEKLNPELLKGIISDKCVYYETPFDEPLIGADPVINQWQKDLVGQSNVRFYYEMLIDDGSKQIVHWNCNWRTAEGIRVLDGVFYFELDELGKLELFRQWWVTK